MADDKTTQANEPSAEPTEPKTYTQEQVEQLIRERVARAKATPPADYEQLKAKAAKWDEMQEKAKTELQKATERAERAEAKASELEHAADVAAWREQVAAETGVSASILRGDTLEELQAHARAISAAMPAYPTIDPGKPAGGGISIESIESIKDPAARVRARAENRGAYKR